MIRFTCANKDCQYYNWTIFYSGNPPEEPICKCGSPHITIINEQDDY